MQGLLRNTRVNGVKLSLLLGPSVPRGASLRKLHERDLSRKPGRKH